MPERPLSLSAALGVLVDSALMVATFDLKQWRKRVIL
jgi:hypothetical protein